MSATAFAPNASAVSPAATAAQIGIAAVRSRHAVAAYSTDRMHPRVFGLAIASYGAMLLVLWLLFVTGADMVVTLFVCTAYFAMYFGVPVAMYRLAAKAAPPAASGSFAVFLRGGLETVSGTISGWSAMVQVLVVPVSLTFGLIAMGIIAKVVA
ncbi:MAG: hypothetical protein AB7O56_07165 [Bauldia sp.]